MATAKIQTVKGLRVEIFSRPLRKNAIRLLTVWIVGADVERGLLLVIGYDRIFPGTNRQIPIYLLTVLTFLYFQGFAICLTLKYVSFSLVFALISKLQGKVFLIQFSLLNSFPQPYPRVLQIPA